MRTILNIIWLVLAGFWLAILYTLAGMIVCIFIVTIPWGLQAFKLASFSLWPFGRTLVKKPGAGAASVLGNVIWLVFAGWWLAIGHLVTALAQAITIIGLPLAAANVKLIPVALWPFGREIVRTADVTSALASHREGQVEIVSIDAALPSRTEPTAIDPPTERQRHIEP